MREFVKYLMLLWMGILSASCVFDEERCVIPADEPHEIIFTIYVEGQRTRASWGEEYPSEVGVPFDFRIKPEELRMVVFTADGTRLGQVNDIYYWPINEEHTEFQFMGKLPAEFVNHVNASGATNPYRFMVLANCGDNTSGEQYVTYSQAQLDPAKMESAIPMWGVKESGVTPLINGRNLDLGTISLLRAAAKVEVKLCDELKDKETEITAATLKYYNQTGYVAPAGWSQVTDTKSLDQENCIRVYRHAAVNMPFVKDEDSGDYYIYITEYDNINYSAERNKISLEFNVGGDIKAFEDAISFCQYRDGKPVEGSHYSIVRNHIYEFEILSIAGSSLELEYHVADWTSEDWDGNGKEYEEHDLSYPTYHNPVVPYDFLQLSATDQATYVIEKEPMMYYSAGDSEAGAFECYFQILAPENVKWKPTIMGTKENYQIRVYRINSNLVQTGTAVFDSGVPNKQSDLDVCKHGEYDWYRIVIFPLSDDGANNTVVEFGISYYQAWTEQYINLYINGEYGNIRWPNSGDNPKIINIRHTSAVQQ